MPDPLPPLRTLALFCKVVDNFGDIGICWRLARQLSHEHGIAVTLWVDDLASFQRLCPSVSTAAQHQDIGGVIVRHWSDQESIVTVDQIADIVIEFFGCDLPPAYIQAMALRDPAPIWINLEGLSAEAWVEGCHTLPSPHPQLRLTKYFYFPGFTAQTGGLLRESDLIARRVDFESTPTARDDFLLRLGLTDAERAAYKVSMFCYPDAPLAALFEAWQRLPMPLTCLVPEGVASLAIEQFLGAAACPGAARARGALTVRVIPFIAQPEYDKLLWACDVNFVRGEDSFVRAQWAGKPFIWHIYPQDKNLHHVKLRAFLQRYAPECKSLVDFSLRWNSADDNVSVAADSWQTGWQDLHDDTTAITEVARNWQHAMTAHGDLAANLVRFAQSQHSSRWQNKV